MIGNGSKTQIDGNGIGNMVDSNEQIKSTGVGFTSAAANGTSGDTFIGNASTAYFGSGTTGSLALGNSNTVGGGDNIGSSFSISGQNFTVGDVSGNNTLLVDSGSSSATVCGNGTVISTAGNQTICDMGDGGSVRVADGVTGNVIYADHARLRGPERPGTGHGPGRQRLRQRHRHQHRRPGGLHRIGRLQLLGRWRRLRPAAVRAAALLPA